MSDIFFTADPHFFHENIINTCKRPFASVEEMNESLIKTYNECVRPEDTLYILGDFAFKFESVKDVNDVLSRIHCKKVLIRGNHDGKFLRDPDFDHSLLSSIKGYYELHLGKIQVVLFHYPIIEWNNMYRGSYHIYGHVHDKVLKAMPKNSLCVSVEQTGYKPVSLEEALAKMGGTLNLE